MSAIYWASAEVLIAASLLGSDRALPPPEELRGTMLAALHQMVLRCRAAGIPDGETAEARYAIVAFIDERILKSNWPGRAEWMNSPLQLQLYREYTAGENFFARMRALLHRPQGSMALEIHYLCLALGFTGAASGGGQVQNAQSYLEAVGARLAGANPAAPISPHALTTDHGARTTSRRPLVLVLSLSCACVVLMGLGLLAWSLDTTMAKTSRDLTAVEAARSGAAGVGTQR
ncbi:MAG TPA: DotU family type IV/VI secretion system protein [Polyangiaceae bacterium]|nr:DotU family type IV/VI secretion system protein [Polyangiaceae bacterium]